MKCGEIRLKRRDGSRSLHWNNQRMCIGGINGVLKTNIPRPLYGEQPESECVIETHNTRVKGGIRVEVSKKGADKRRDICIGDARLERWDKYVMRLTDRQLALTGIKPQTDTFFYIRARICAT